MTLTISPPVTPPHLLINMQIRAIDLIKMQIILTGRIKIQIN